jgi:hypothetical protein
MFARTALAIPRLFVLACLVAANPTVAVAGTLIGVYAPREPGSPRFFAAVYEENSDADRQQTAKTCTAFVRENEVMAAQFGDWCNCPFLVDSQKLMVGCVGADGRLRFYVTACCHGNNVCAWGYRPDADAVPEFVPPGRGRDFQLGWEEIMIGNFYNTFNIQFRCQMTRHYE